MIRNFLLLSGFVFLSLFIYAAEVTDVADAFDKNNPFDCNVNVLFKNTHTFSLIKREYNSDWKTYDGGTGANYATTESRRVETNEYSGNPEVQFQRELLVSAEFGLFHDLSLSLDVPIVLKNAYKGFLENIDKEKSDGATVVPSDNSLINSGLFPESGDYYYNHKGVGDIAIGMQWAPYNQERGKDYFSWLLGFRIKLPTGAVATPEGMNRTVTDNNGIKHIEQTGKTGGVGDGLYVFNLRTAVAKRYEILEPYMAASINLPVKGAKSIIEKTRQEYTINIGFDFTPWENKDEDQKVVLRTDLEFKYTTRGNAYNYITDARWVYDDRDPVAEFGWVLPAGKDKYYNILPMEDGYFTTTGLFKMNFRVWKYVQFGGYASVAYKQKHYLTNAVEDLANSEDPANMDNEPGFIPGIDSENTTWRDPSGKDQYKTKSGGRLMTEQDIEIGWGAYLTVMF